MSNETSKAHDRRSILGYFDKYLVGYGIDIGCGRDVLSIASGTVVPYDKIHQDKNHEAQIMPDIEDDSFNFAYSSNCLEHIPDPVQALNSWIRIVEPGGIIFFTVPDENLYEHGRWPSRFHKGHLHSFTIKTESKMPKSIFLPEWLKQFDVDIVSIEIVDTGYDYELPDTVDQTQIGAEAFIEVILQKR